MDKLAKTQEFIKKYCPFPNHYCNGKHIPNCVLRKNMSKWYDTDRTRDKEHPCEHFVSGKCRHSMRHYIGRWSDE